MAHRRADVRGGAALWAETFHALKPFCTRRSSLRPSATKGFASNLESNEQAVEVIWRPSPRPGSNPARMSPSPLTRLRVPSSRVGSAFPPSLARARRPVTT